MAHIEKTPAIHNIGRKEHTARCLNDQVRSIDLTSMRFGLLVLLISMPDVAFLNHDISAVFFRLPLPVDYLSNIHLYPVFLFYFARTPSKLRRMAGKSR